MLKKILFLLFFSQIYYLWVFWLADNDYYVIQKEKNLCGVFTKWTSRYPNWLQEWWEAIFLDTSLKTRFSLNPYCKSWSIWNCCRDMGYKYAWVPIGQTYISLERKSAEFLARKNIIQIRSFNPHEYKLDKMISRKEITKVIMNISNEKVEDTCEWIFADVLYDWGCKYIESALKHAYITWKQGFRPDENLTKAEAMKLILLARWIGKRYETNFWQEDYISTAYYLWYIDEKFSDYNTFATRGWIFTIVAKTYKDFSY